MSNTEKNATDGVQTGGVGSSALTGFPKVEGFPPIPEGFPVLSFPDMLQDDGQAVPKEGTAPKNVKFFEGVTRLNKGETGYAWNEFGGDKMAAPDGDRSFITRIIEHESKKNGVRIKLVERLTREADGYGSISWRLDIGAVARRKPPKNPFDVAWHPFILDKVRDVVANGMTVAAASKALADELGVSFSTIRANLWVADKWARGESTSFLPNRSMIKPIFELLCELGKKDKALESLAAYCKEVKKPSEYVLAVLGEHKV